MVDSFQKEYFFAEFLRVRIDGDSPLSIIIG